MHPTTADATLAELAALGLRGARVVARMMEIEAQAAELVASWLPAPTGETEARDLHASQVRGLAVDQVVMQMETGVPHVDTLARALDRLGRCVRRSVALRQRLEAGWPRMPADTREAMVRRQVARGVADAIRRERDGDAAEKLFDELAERLDDPGFATECLAEPVEAVIRRIGTELGLAMAAAASLAPHPDTS